MKILLLIACFLLHITCCFSQLPDSDIWLFDIKDSAGKLFFLNPVNITNRKGYDNQPVFSPDNRYILYSSQRDSIGPTDIFKYDINTKKIFSLTKTPTSEYSPAFTPDGKHVSVVMVEKDSAQRVWKFPLMGGVPVCIMDKVKQIGYYCWINNDSMAIYVLTKPAFTLQIANVHTQQSAVIADSIGRCMRMHGGSLWYAVKTGRFWNVFEYEPKTKKSKERGIIESEDFWVWGKNDEVWSLSESSIVSGFMNSKTGAIELVNMKQFGITKPARIAISPDGKKLAVVSVK